jgi:hypothetical protein
MMGEPLDHRLAVSRGRLHGVLLGCLALRGATVARKSEGFSIYKHLTGGEGKSHAVWKSVSTAHASLVSKVLLQRSLPAARSRKTSEVPYKQGGLQLLRSTQLPGWHTDGLPALRATSALQAAVLARSLKTRAGGALKRLDGHSGIEFLCVLKPLGEALGLLVVSA